MYKEVNIMTIQEILDNWHVDIQINKRFLDDEALKSSALHHKYMSMLVRENMLLVKAKNDYNVLLLDKYVFYTEGAKTIKDIQKAPRGAVLKTEAEKYLQADPDMIEAITKLALQQEKVDLLKSILKQIEKRSFDVKNALDFQKFMAGGH